MKIKKVNLQRLIENFLNEEGTDPGDGQEVDKDKTELGKDYVDQQMMMRGVQPQPSADDEVDRALAQHDIDFGSDRNIKIAFGPSPEGRDLEADPITDDEITRHGYEIEDPTPNQIRHGQDYHRLYKGIGDEDNMPSVYDTKTQSFDFDDEDTEEDDYGRLGMTDPAVYDDDEDTIEAGITLSADRDDDFDLSISDIDKFAGVEDFGTFEDDEDTDDEDSEDEKPRGIFSRIKDFFSE